MALWRVQIPQTILESARVVSRGAWVMVVGHAVLVTRITERVDGGGEEAGARWVAGMPAID